MVGGPHVTFTADTRQAVAEINKMQLGTQRALGVMNSAAAISGMALKGLGAAILGVGASAMITYGAVASFNQSLTHVRALGDLTQKDMNKLAASINKVSVAYGVSGDVIADGTVILSKAGLTVAEINDSIAAMTALSKANAISFGEAANMTVFAVETFKKSYGDVTDILDKMQVAAQQSILDIGDLQKAFAYAGSTAMMTGVSYEELLAIMATLSNRALEAGISARSTNKMLLDIVQHAPELEKFYQSMGKNFDIIQDGQLNVTELIAALSDATINVEFLQGATDVFTVRALRAFGLLAGAADDYAVMLDEINNASGELERTVNVQLESLSARLELLKFRMVALLRSPEVLAGLELMVEGFEKLAVQLIPTFTQSLSEATTVFARLLANERLVGMFSELVEIIFRFVTVGSKFLEILTGGEAYLLRFAIAIKFLQIMTSGYIATMFELNQAFTNQINEYLLLEQNAQRAAIAEQKFSVAVMQNKLALSEKGVTIAKAGMLVDTFIQSIMEAYQAENWWKYSTDELTMAMAFLIEELQLADNAIKNVKLGMSEFKLVSDQTMLTLTMISTGFQMIATAISQAVMVGMLFNTMDLSGPMKWIMWLNAAISALTFGLMMASAYMNFFKGAATQPNPVTAVGVGVASALAMTGAMYGVYHATKGEWDVQEADLATKLATLQEQYTPVDADTGMFVSNRRTYDEGGTIGPRHQLVYVEPGEQIISKTQGMVGMGGGITVNVGDVYAQDGTDFAEKLASALPIALRNVSYRGAF